MGTSTSFRLEFVTHMDESEDSVMHVLAEVERRARGNMEFWPGFCLSIRGFGASCFPALFSTQGTCSMVKISDVLDRATVYTAWQKPFIRSKLIPILNDSDFTASRRILDLGCGPGVNAPYFKDVDYTGLDWNDDYINYARRRYGRTFISADACAWQPPAGEEFDLVLANSFFHHIDDENVDRILERISRLLTPEGTVHILDLVLPETHRIGRWLANHDRGDFPRPLERWRDLFNRHFVESRFEPYSLDLLGVGLWQMVHFKGHPRTKKDD